jgi:hypothetical protein
VDVEDAVLEGVQELDVIHALIGQVRGIVIEAESACGADGVEGALGGGDVEGDLRGMDFQGEVDVLLFEFIEDRPPAAAKSSKPRCQKF